MLGHSRTEGTKGYCTAHSPDGLRWTLDEGAALPGGDTCTLSRDPATGEFLTFHKRTHDHRGQRRRLVYLSTTRDMALWSAAELVLAPDATDDAQVRDEGGQFAQFYNMSAFPYAGQWLGLVTHFRFTGRSEDTAPGQSPDDGPIDVQLVHSPDGRSWERCEDRSPIIPNGPHVYDAGCILGVANSPVVADDEMWVYYTAITTPHGGALPEKQISIARASWPLDRWVSLDAGSSGGLIETTEVVTEGRRLLVNVDAGAGELQVELVGSDGAVIPGYGRADCHPVMTDALRQPVRWQSHTDLPQMRPVCIRFYLRNAKLFAWQVE